MVGCKLVIRHAAAFVVLAALSAAAARAENAVKDDFHKQRDAAMAKAVSYLTAAINDDGIVDGEYPLDNARSLYGGKTALVAYALLMAEVDYNKGPLSKCIKWLTEAKLNGTYAVAFRACAFSMIKKRPYRQILGADAKWLMDYIAKNGAYTYGEPAKTDPNIYDNCNSHVAVMGMWAASQAGVPVPLKYWQSVRNHWDDEQQGDGGWGYNIPHDASTTTSYGSMTAAGVATLFACNDALNRKDFIRCTITKDPERISNGLAWLENRFTVEENPGKRQNYYYYWLFALERVGLISGRKYIGSHDWYREGVRELIRTQRNNGSWGYGDRVADTAFALLFLARGRHPVLVNKLQYTGNWNARPRDMANVTAWISYNFERNVRWQIVKADSPMDDWRDAPIMYISGAGPIELTVPQIENLRTFVLQGGLIVSEAAGNNADFTLDMQKIYKRMFPEFALARLADGDIVKTLHFKPEVGKGLSGISNGARLLAIHAPQEMSLALQLGPTDNYRPWFEQFANIYLYQTDLGNVHRPEGLSWPVAKKFEPKATIRVARLKYRGNCDPEPLAWQRFATVVGNRYSIRIETSELMPAGELDPEKWPIVYIAGTTNVKFSRRELAFLKAYLVTGGTIIAEAVGGSERFAKAVEDQIFPLLPGAWAGSFAASRVSLEGPAAADRVYYREPYADTLGNMKDTPRMKGVIDDDKIKVVLITDDVSGGMVGYPCYGLHGYTPESAIIVVTNLLSNLSQKITEIKSPETQPAETQPEATQPQTQPASQPGK